MLSQKDKTAAASPTPKNIRGTYKGRKKEKLGLYNNYAIKEHKFNQYTLPQKQLYKSVCFWPLTRNPEPNLASKKTPWEILREPIL